MPKLLSVPHRRQLSDGYCLPACIEMVLAAQGIEQDQTRLAQKLGVIPGIGLPGSRIKQLATSQIQVTYGEGELGDLQTAVSNRTPPITLVSTGELPYWDTTTPHAVVVTGIDEKAVWLHDPAKEQPHIEVPLGDFLLAWDMMMNLYAIIK